MATHPSPTVHAARSLVATPIVLVCALACSGTRPGSEDQASPASQEPMNHAGMATEVVVPAGVLYTAADVHFMQGMIAHHAQAIYMSHLAETRGASERLLKFAQKIDQSQAAEIVLMQGWLVDNGQFAPDTASYHTMTMPGMLTPAQLEELGAARGAEFDRLFLVLMIQHHEGALRMVADLLATPRAAQDVDVNVFANDVHLVQTAEIEMMREMLSDL